MKFRCDFVTNSSSSSFILAFSSEEKISSDIRQKLAWLENNEYFNAVYNDCMNAEKMNFEQMLETARREMKWIVRFDIKEQAEDNSMNYRDVIAWSKSPEFEECVSKEIEQRLTSIKNTANGNSVFVRLSYSNNNGDGELEHFIVPSLDCCIASFSHH